VPEHSPPANFKINLATLATRLLRDVAPECLYISLANMKDC
jgi:hypothetical protein